MLMRFLIFVSKLLLSGLNNIRLNASRAVFVLSKLHWVSCLTRQGKKLVLTPGGKKIAKVGKTYYKRFEDLVTEIQQENNRMMGGVSLGTLFGIGKSWIGSRMVDFSQEYPDLSVKVEMDYPDRLIAGFEGRDFDCLVLPRSLTPSYSESILLHSETATLVVPKNLNIKLDSSTTLKDLSEYPVIFFEERDPLFYGWCKNRFGTVPRTVKPRLVVNAFGQTVARRTASNIQDELFLLNIHQLLPGFYTLNVLANGQNTSRKVLIK